MCDCKKDTCYSCAYDLTQVKILECRRKQQGLDKNSKEYKQLEEEIDRQVGLFN